MGAAGLRWRPITNVRLWPIVAVKEILNVAILNVPLAPESENSLRSG